MVSLRKSQTFRALGQHHQRMSRRINEARYALVLRISSKRRRKRSAAERAMVRRAKMMHL